MNLRAPRNKPKWKKEANKMNIFHFPEQLKQMIIFRRDAIWKKYCWMNSMKNSSIQSKFLMFGKN